MNRVDDTFTFYLVTHGQGRLLASFCRETIDNKMIS